MEDLIIKNLIKDQLLDFDKLLKKNYRHIGLTEIEAFFLMELYSLKEKGIKSLNPKKLVKNLSLSEKEATDLLDSMMQRNYLSFDIKENKNGKMTESFSLDQTIKKIVDYYKNQINKDIVNTEKKHETDENEIAEILETQLQRQLKPLEIEVIIKWIKDYNYNKDQIKDAIIDSVKSGKISISYIDGVLLKKKRNKDDKLINTNRKKSKALKDFLES
ncbi:MAG: DnaD domain protein [Candidatus Izimaplasma sp.]|nr:DnaD domain protein [Candidatus Izimaplasma bacterium]